MLAETLYSMKHFPYHNQYKNIISQRPFQFFLPAKTKQFHSLNPFTDDYYQTFSTLSLQTSISCSPTSLPLSSAPQNDQQPAECSVPIPIRTSTRISHPPFYLNDYVCSNMISDLTNQHWCNLVTLDTIPANSKSIVYATSNLIEPTSYKQASQDHRWIQAMNDEITALKENNTWSLVDLPPGTKPI